MLNTHSANAIDVSHLINCFIETLYSSDLTTILIRSNQSSYSLKISRKKCFSQIIFAIGGSKNNCTNCVTTFAEWWWWV